MVDIAAAAALTVTIYQNGDPNFYGKKFVVNRRRVRTFDAFLDNVTVDIKSSKAVRRLCTPLGTHEVRSLETLENGGRYVAVTSIGRTGFKKLNYGELGVAKTSPRGRKPRGGLLRQKLVVAGRARQEYEWEKLALKIIKVYRNGDEFQPSTRVLLKRKVLQDMELVLSTCQEHMVLNSAIAALYTTDGRLVQDTQSLENGGMYVAVERRRPFFQHVSYGDLGHVPRTSAPLKLPPIGNGLMTAAAAGKPKHAGKAKSVSPTKPKNTLITPRAQGPDSRANPPSASRDLTPENLPSERAKVSSGLDSEGDFRPSVSPPLRLGDDTPISDLSRTQQDVTVAYDGGPSVFDASGLQSEKAKDVRETKDTAEEKPVDLLPAEEVMEDLEEEEAGIEGEEREGENRSPAKRDDDSDNEIESIPDVSEKRDVEAEEPSQKASGGGEQEIDGEEPGHGSRRSTPHSRPASHVGRESPEADSAEKSAGSVPGSPRPERSESRKSRSEEGEAKPTDGGVSAGDKADGENPVAGSAEEKAGSLPGSPRPERSESRKSKNEEKVRDKEEDAGDTGDGKNVKESYGDENSSNEKKEDRNEHNDQPEENLRKNGEDDHRSGENRDVPTQDGTSGERS